MQTTKFISSPLLPNYAYSCNFFNLNSIYAQSLRWKRKPIWLPTAKTKVFRVPPRPIISKEEHVEIQRLYNNYRTYYRSVRAYLRELYGQDEVELDQSVLDKLEETDFNKCMTVNEAWNKQIAAERVIRLRKEKEEKAAKILQHIESNKARQKELQLKLLEKIKEAKKISPTFITKDNIDEAIEEALLSIVDHNKAMNPDGTWFIEASKITTKEKEERKS